MNINVNECFICGGPVTQMEETVSACDHCKVVFELAHFSYSIKGEGGEVAAGWIVRENANKK